VSRVPGHEVVGRIDAVGSGVQGWVQGQRVGFGFLAGSCGYCEFCRNGNLVNCRNQEYTGIGSIANLGRRWLILWIDANHAGQSQMGLQPLGVGTGANAIVQRLVGNLLSSQLTLGAFVAVQCRWGRRSCCLPFKTAAGPLIRADHGHSSEHACRPELNRGSGTHRRPYRCSVLSDWASCARFRWSGLLAKTRPQSCHRDKTIFAVWQVGSREPDQLQKLFVAGVAAICRPTQNGCF
jgi:hypothetical protein